MVGVQSVPSCRGPRRLSQSPTGSGSSSSIPKSSHFLFFPPHGCKYHLCVIPVEKWPAQLMLRQARPLTRTHIHTHTHLWWCYIHTLCHRPEPQYGFLYEQQLASCANPDGRGGWGGGRTNTIAPRLGVELLPDADLYKADH